MQWFLRPSFHLAALHATPVIDASEIKITNADRAGKRGKFGENFQDDGDWAEQIKKEKLKKMQDASKSNKMSEETMKKMKEIKESNERVAKVVQRLIAALSVVELFSKLNLVSTSLLIDLIPALLPLTKSPLTSDACLTSLTSLSLCTLSKTVVQRGRAVMMAHDLAASICTVAKHSVMHTENALEKGESEMMSSLVYLSAPISRTLTELNVHLSRGIAST